MTIFTRKGNFLEPFCFREGMVNHEISVFEGFLVQGLPGLVTGQARAGPWPAGPARTFCAPFIECAEPSEESAW